MALACPPRLPSPAVLLLLAALATLGPHAAEAELHAQDPEAEWVRAEPVLQPFASALAPAVSKRIYGYLPYWQSIDLTSFHWDLITDVIAFSAGVGTDGTIGNAHALPGAALVSAAHAHGVKVHSARRSSTPAAAARSRPSSAT